MSPFILTIQINLFFEWGRRNLIYKSEISYNHFLTALPNRGFNVGQHYHRSEESPLSPLSSEISIIEGEKERIERYRSKRNLRNFNKKIKYECRKTLADSRPRIRGRFAKNDEVEKSSQNQLSHMGIEEDDEDDSNWINFLDSFSASLIP
ncbi:hypothetical protein HYC85_031773 [Camellia sinensis]|uniref:CCT domain-containing protein n=1 Tax=Camellia sinensis TaxID=4442 RepID=A0A7J7FRE5_CAMSI|nr:hypothetical protein HYC85_031773 [Camellia sinensis]